MHAFGERDALFEQLRHAFVAPHAHVHFGQRLQYAQLGRRRVVELGLDPRRALVEQLLGGALPRLHRIGLVAGTRAEEAFEEVLHRRCGLRVDPRNARLLPRLAGLPERDGRSR